MIEQYLFYLISCKMKLVCLCLIIVTMWLLSMTRLVFQLETVFIRLCESPVSQLISEISKRRVWLVLRNRVCITRKRLIWVFSKKLTSQLSWRPWKQHTQGNWIRLFYLLEMAILKTWLSFWQSICIKKCGYLDTHRTQVWLFRKRHHRIVLYILIKSGMRFQSPSVLQELNKIK